MKYPSLLIVAASVSLFGAGCQIETKNAMNEESKVGQGQEQGSAASETGMEKRDEARTQGEAQSSANANEEAKLHANENAAVQASGTVQTSSTAPNAGAGIGAEVKIKAKADIETYTVTIQNFEFSQKTVTVERGDKVVFTNRDQTRHSATSDSGAFDSGLLGQDDSFTLDTATLAAGSYPFHCTIHPMMKGTLIVK